MDSNGIFWNSSMLHCIPLACIEWTGFQRIRSMESWNPSEDSSDFHGIRGRPWTHGTNGVPWIPRNSMEGKIFHGSYWVPWNSTVSIGFHRVHWVPWIRSKFHRRQKYPSFVWGSMEVHGFKRTLRIQRKPIKSIQFQWFHGVSWKSMELHCF